MSFKMNSPLRDMYTMVESVTENVVPLYDDIHNLLFFDIDYYRFIGNVPMWMSDAGRCAESPMDKVTFEKYLGLCSSPYTFKLLYWYDLQGLLAALQDRIANINSLLEEFYRILPYENKHKANEYTNATRCLDAHATKAQSTVNNIFVSLASAFDLYAKVAYEVYNIDKYAFDKYGKLRSRSKNILYNKNLETFPELKAEGLLLSEPVCVRKVLSFRDEFIHNGSWDYRCAIYETWIGEEPSDVFMLSPDMNPNGNFCTSGARNKFYSQDNRINILLLPLLEEVLTVFDKSISELRSVCQVNTKAAEKDAIEANTDKYILDLVEWYKKLKSV